MTIKLDVGRRVKVTDLILHMDNVTAGLLVRNSVVVVVVVVVVLVVVVLVLVASLRFVDHNQPRDKQWTQQTRQYLTTLQSYIVALFSPYSVLRLLLTFHLYHNNI